ncbi:MAG: hypothetical protein N4A57_12060 [Anaeromicrobium sp.]|jgi:hypothetical protein|uniref:hypothetical protein n=1 Tax=Anaeromicrobium sp. TaxID=1929132 RepID=UPI0025FAFD09|nr:hypothetical protein [Anaeromicrobium sp.]MCT4594987.1 hypothetical protein [Anaeromicrobium sp.]
MIIYKKDIIRVLTFIIATIVLSLTLFKIIKNNSQPYVLGGYIHEFEKQKNETGLSRPVINTNENDFDGERFQRPSKEPALKLKYEYKGYEGLYKDLLPPYIPIEYPQKYNKPTDVINAYYSILKDASNTIGYNGGCGTVGRSRTPYPFAYELLSSETKEEISLNKFIDSFSGIGHTTLLKLYSAFQPPYTPENTKYYMVEIEIITGPPYSKEEEYKPTYFAYYYGILTTIYDEEEGWKIKSVDYIPEDFLCAPWHGWDWDSKALVQIVYGNWYKLIDKIDEVEKKDSYISMYAKGKDNEYRFDFIRITNGEDILIHEYIKVNDKWKEVNLLKPGHQHYKLSILSFNK